MAHILVEELEKRYAGLTAVAGLNLEAEDGEFVTLLGPSGCGKTTTLLCIAGLERPSEGHILFDKKNVTDLSPADRNIAMVFQDYALYPHMSVRENLAFGLKVRRLNKGEIERRVADAAAMLGLEQLLERRPAYISGGQRQRVALGRAVVRDAAIFLMDEPLSNLDASLRVRTRTEIKALQRHLGTTTIYVTHDQEEAMVLSDRIAVMRDGCLQQYAAPQAIYGDPANLFVATFIGNPPLNVWEGYLQRENGHLLFRSAGVSVPLDPTVLRDGERPVSNSNRDVKLGIRPESVLLSRCADSSYQTQVLEGKVLLTEPVGPVTYVDVAVGELTLRASTEPADGFCLDERVKIHFRSTGTFLFEGHDGARL